LADQDWIGLMIYKNLRTGLDRIQFDQIRTGLELKHFTVCSSLLRGYHFVLACQGYLKYGQLCNHTP